MRLRCYGWNTSKEESLWRKKEEKKKNKVEEIQLANLVSLEASQAMNKQNVKNANLTDNFFSVAYLTLNTNAHSSFDYL